MALSGLAPATKGYQQVRLQECNCKGLGANAVSVWTLPAATKRAPGAEEREAEAEAGSGTGR